MLMVQGSQIRGDLDIPVMKVLTETEYENFGAAQIRFRQPDTERYRTWWMTGTSHSDHQSGLASAALRSRDLPEGPIFGADWQPPTRSRVEAHHMTAAAMEAMEHWVARGVEPARSALPVWAEGEAPLVERDRFGNALGGIRLATLEVPVATDQGLNPSTCGISGVHVPFDTETLQQLYPTHEAYVREFTEAASRNIRDGFLLPEDAEQMIDRAEASVVGTGLECGPLCANVSNFAVNPSTSNLRDHTEIYHFRGGKNLVRMLDRATLLTAQGYTAAERGKVHAQWRAFTEAAQQVALYRTHVAKMPGQGLAATETANLLVGFADTLIDELRAQARS